MTDIGSCVICGLKCEGLRTNDEQLMFVLLSWYQADGVNRDPDGAMGDMKALLHHIQDSGFAIVRCLPDVVEIHHEATTDEAKN